MGFSDDIYDFFSFFLLWKRKRKENGVCGNFEHKGGFSFERTFLQMPTSSHKREREREGSELK